MSFVALAVRVLIASPSDVAEERDLIERVVHRWNADHSDQTGVVLLPVRWETSTSPSLGGSAQGVVNHQIVESADVLLGVFWTRMGTPTGNHVSGTAEEIQQFVDTDRPASLWFSTRPVVPDNLDPEQWEALKAFRDDMRTRGLLGEFGSLDELERQIFSTLTRVVGERFASGAVAPLPEASHAHVSVEHLDLGSRDKLVLTNTSTVEARNVEVSTVDVEDGGVGWHIIGDEAPIAYLAPGGSVSLLLGLSAADPPRVNCTVTWVNPDDSPGQSRHTLAIP